MWGTGIPKGSDEVRGKRFESVRLSCDLEAVGAPSMFILNAIVCLFAAIAEVFCFQNSFFFPFKMRNPLLRNTPPWVMLFAICLPDVKDTDARNHEKATYYPDYAIYHDVDRYNR